MHMKLILHELYFACKKVNSTVRTPSAKQLISAQQVMLLQ